MREGSEVFEPSLSFSYPGGLSLSKHFVSCSTTAAPNPPVILPGPHYGPGVFSSSYSLRQRYVTQANILRGADIGDGLGLSTRLDA